MSLYRTLWSADSQTIWITAGRLFPVLMWLDISGSFIVASLKCSTLGKQNDLAFFPWFLLNSLTDQGHQFYFLTCHHNTGVPSLVLSLTFYFGHLTFSLSVISLTLSFSVIIHMLKYQQCIIHINQFCSTYVMFQHFNSFSYYDTQA